MKELLAALAFGASLAAAGEGSGDVWRPFEATLAPQAMHEECMRLDAGQRRRYHWKSDSAVDFNIHYHRGNEVFYPVKRDGMRGDGGTFAAKSGEDYCWMWTARNAPAKLEGRIEIK
ncbi:MAG: hypothetical protein ACXWAC_08875 [Usitatibacter sp.]